MRAVTPASGPIDGSAGIARVELLCLVDNARSGELAAAFAEYAQRPEVVHAVAFANGAPHPVAQLGREDVRARFSKAELDALQWGHVGGGHGTGRVRRWGSFARFLDDGRICLTNNAAERTLRPLCLGRRSWLFAGSDRGGERAAVMYTLIGTAKLNDVDPQAWLADVLDCIADLPQTRLDELLPWHWKAHRPQALAA